MRPLRVRQRLGKYVIERRLGEGGFATVYQARDTIEGIRVALKVPYPHLLGDDTLEDFRREVRLIAKLEHPNILPLKTAQFVEDNFLIVCALGKMTLEERLAKRMSLDTALDFSRQILAGTAYAHGEKIVHCDIKPDNFILFEKNRLRLADFGVAQVAQKTLRGSGAGTLGYMAPEQAMGQPSFRSDVFALGLVLYRMFSGVLPDYPFDWPPPGHEVLLRKLSAGHVEVVRRAMQLRPSDRYPDAGAMLSAFESARPRRKAGSSKGSSKPSSSASTDWKSIQKRQFRREFGKALDSKFDCDKCGGPVSEAMKACPWCGKDRRVHPGATSFPQQCPRCYRGMKLDWRYCPWCFGAGFEPPSDRQYDDVRYAARCQGEGCTRRLLMPFMQYCPWCRRKVRKKWKLAGSNRSCRNCGWGIAADYWSYCPWCADRLGKD